MKCSRRDFMKAGFGSFAYLSAAATVPAWFAKSAHGLQGGLSDDRIFVLLQLAGGNDGINTVIPYEDDRYHGNDLRPNVRIPSDYHQLGDGLNALHPRLGNLADWYRDGYMSVIQNVGYPNPNLSHFLSTTFWEYGASPGSAQAPEGQGWLSRFFDNECSGVPVENIDPLAMMAASTSNVPESMRGSDFYIPPRASRLSNFSIRTGNDLRGSYLSALNRLSAPTGDLDFIQRIENVAEGAVQAFTKAAETPDLRSYPSDRLGTGLSNVSKIIRSGANTKIFYVSQGGYDTHSNQNSGNPLYGEHADLMSVLNNSLHAFLGDMKDAGRLDDVLVLTFSEFGRRIEENGSRGTDHGTANSMMAFGGGAAGGVYGGQPDLSPDGLVRGNLQHQIDFRSVFSNVIEDWFNGDASAVFGADYNDPVLGISTGMGMAPFVNKSGANQRPGSVGCA